MSFEFIKQINEYVIEATMEASDEEVFLTAIKIGYPTQEDIRSAHLLVNKAIKNNRKQRLEQKRSEFLELKKNREITSAAIKSKKTTQEMLADIVKAIQNKNNIPENLLIAFREEEKNGKEDKIKKIWENLVELSIIVLNDDESQS